MLTPQYVPAVLEAVGAQVGSTTSSIENYLKRQWPTVFAHNVNVHWVRAKVTRAVSDALFAGLLVRPSPSSSQLKIGRPWDGISSGAALAGIRPAHPFEPRASATATLLLTRF